jgi:type VI secretion system protein ImpK
LARETLARIFQEPLTTIVRLGSGTHSPADAQCFRVQMVRDLEAASVKARGQGFNEEDARSAIFAIVAFLDETILNVKPPALSDWLRSPLQHQMFGNFMAGNVFFVNLERILQRPQSNETIDLIELYGLCILLGYQGRFAGRRAELKTFARTCVDKIRRFRGSSITLTQGLLPADDAPISTGDPWHKRLLWCAIVCAAIALTLFGMYKLFLSSSATELRSLTELTR